MVWYSTRAGSSFLSVCAPNWYTQANKYTRASLTLRRRAAPRRQNKGSAVVLSRNVAEEESGLRRISNCLIIDVARLTLSQHFFLVICWIIRNVCRMRAARERPATYLRAHHKKNDRAFVPSGICEFCDCRIAEKKKKETVDAAIITNAFSTVCACLHSYGFTYCRSVPLHTYTYLVYRNLIYVNFQINDCS